MYSFSSKLVRSSAVVFLIRFLHLLAEVPFFLFAILFGFADGLMIDFLMINDCVCTCSLAFLPEGVSQGRSVLHPSVRVVFVENVRNS